MWDDGRGMVLGEPPLSVGNNSCVPAYLRSDCLAPNADVAR
jgi:hypothetical protein